MKNIIKNTLVIIILLLIYLKRPLVINSIIEGMDLWKKSVFPSVFPIMIISDFILSTNLINIISKIFGKAFNKLFKVSKYASYVFLMSLFSGTPTNAKYIKDLLDNKIIETAEASKILANSLLYNPLLILTITPFLKTIDRIYLIIFNIIANLIIGLINRNYRCNILNKEIKPKNFNLVNSINNAVNISLLILGSIITFITINAVIPINHPLITGLLEITNGINMIKTGNIIYKYQFIFTAILLSFGGLSILTQIKSIFKDTDIDYSLYYKSRIIHLILMLIMSYFRFSLR
jgi:hypothetical protein